MSDYLFDTIATLLQTRPVDHRRDLGQRTDHGGGSGGCGYARADEVVGVEPGTGAGGSVYCTSAQHRSRSVHQDTDGQPRGWRWFLNERDSRSNNNDIVIL